MFTTKQKIFLASLLYKLVRLLRKTVGKSDHGKFHKKGIFWQLDLSEGIDFAIYLFGCFEPDVVSFYQKRIKEKDVILDIGANIGAHTLQFAKIVGSEGRVLAVEATEYACVKLQKNLSLNEDLGKIVDVEHAYLSAQMDDAVESAIYSRWSLKEAVDKHPNHAGSLESTGEAQTVTVDFLIESHAIEKVDWIKLDVDGNEPKVIGGALATLKRFKPSIMMEIAPSYYSGEAFKDFARMIDSLRELGYKFYEMPTMKAVPDTAENLKGYIKDGAGINACLLME